MEAKAFSASTSYAVGDLCIYNGDLYQFTSSHSGAWNASHVRAFDDVTSGKVDRIIAGYKNAIAAADYADSVVVTSSLITGTRYKYTLSN